MPFNFGGLKKSKERKAIEKGMDLIGGEIQVKLAVHKE